MIILKFLGLLLAIGFVLGLLALTALFFSAKKMADSLKGGVNDPRRGRTGADSGPALEARECPYCGTFVAAPPTLDKSGTCDQCHKQVKRAGK